MAEACGCNERLSNAVDRLEPPAASFDVDMYDQELGVVAGELSREDRAHETREDKSFQKIGERGQAVRSSLGSSGTEAAGCSAAAALMFLPPKYVFELMMQLPRS